MSKVLEERKRILFKQNVYWSLHIHMEPLHIYTYTYDDNNNVGRKTVHVTNIDFPQIISFYTAPNHQYIRVVTT